ncbi:MAG: CDP-alcohol phosphatidyltransferase family protein [Anaerolineaceae bacterium]|jgi:archaetidylinositol phosphate synthase
MENTNPDTSKDKRTNDILLGPLERPALQFFARNMPAWVNSDMLTVLGLLGSILASIAYVMVGRGEIKGNPWLFVASLGFVINWFGDSLDGTLARYRRHERPNYGYYTDHAIDGITSLLLFGGIGLSGIARFDISMIALSCWLLLMIQVYLKTHVTGTFEMTSIGIGPTEVRLMAIILNTTLFFTGIGGYIWNPTIKGQVIGMTIGSIIIALLAVIFLIYYIYQVTRTAIILAAQDEERLIRRREKEARKAEKARLKAEKKAAKEKENHQAKLNKTDQHLDKA